MTLILGAQLKFQVQEPPELDRRKLKKHDILGYTTNIIIHITISWRFHEVHVLNHHNGYTYIHNSLTKTFHQTLNVHELVHEWGFHTIIL